LPGLFFREKPFRSILQPMCFLYILPKIILILIKNTTVIAPRADLMSNFLLFNGGQHMRKLFSLVLMLLVMSSFAHAQYKGKYVGWSTGYVYGTPMSAGLYKAFTHLCNFHVTVTTSGGLGTGDLRNGHASFVSACHANQTKAILSIGGAGEHFNFDGACSNAATQTTLVKNIINMTIANGYDGVDLDWEVAEDPNYDNVQANVQKFYKFHKQVCDSVKAHPPLLITAAVTDDWYPNCSAIVCAMMDQANAMSYDISAANELNDANAVFSRGAPKANHGIGFDGNSFGLADNLAKCRLAIDNGFGGVMAWAVTGFSAAMLDSLARYVNPNRSTIALAPSRMRSVSHADLSVRTVGLNGVFYTVPASVNGTTVDLGMYDVKGCLVKTIFHGTRSAGTFVAPMDNVCAGTYVFRLSANSSVQTTRAFVVK
jgi:hypothetical protein